MPRGGQACNFSRREEGGGLVEPPRSLLKVDGLADPTIMQCYIHVDYATDSSRPKLGRQPQGVGREENRACPQHLRSTRTRHTDAPAGFNLTFFSRPSVQNTTKRSQTMKTETWVMPNPPYAISRTKAPEVRRAEIFVMSVCALAGRVMSAHAEDTPKSSPSLNLQQSETAWRITLLVACLSHAARHHRPAELTLSLSWQDPDVVSILGSTVSPPKCFKTGNGGRPLSEPLLAPHSPQTNNGYASFNVCSRHALGRSVTVVALWRRMGMSAGGRCMLAFSSIQDFFS